MTVTIPKRKPIPGRYVVRVGDQARVFRSANHLSVEFADGRYRRALTWLDAQMTTQGEPFGIIEHWDGDTLVQSHLHHEDGDS